VTIDLEYVADRWDWVGRVLCLAGLSVVAVWLLGNRGAWLRRALIAPAKLP
jgi:drug/metabolite transporter superfamily protein YnfA